MPGAFTSTTVAYRACGAVRNWAPSVRELPGGVWRLECGALVNSLGSGFVLPFAFIYFHDVRRFSLVGAGLIVATISAVPLASAPVSGALVDRFSARAVLTGCLVALAAAFAALAIARSPWLAVAAAAVAGAGNGGVNPSQTSLLGQLTPPGRRHIAISLQRAMVNLGLGLGGMTGGLIASTSSPWSFQALFLADAVTFVLYIGVLFAFVPTAPHPEWEDAGRDPRPASRSRYRTVLRDGAFVRVLVLNAVLCAAGMAMFQSVLSVYARNFAGVSESAIGGLFLLNTLLIVTLQLPVARALEGRRRLPGLRIVAIVWAVGLVTVAAAGSSLTGAAAAVVIAIAVVLWSAGECILGAIFAPLTVDLAPVGLLGRYLALTNVAWQFGFTVAPAIAGVALGHSPAGTWLIAAGVCLAAGSCTTMVERRLPRDTWRTPEAPATLQSAGRGRASGRAAPPV